MKWSKPKCAAYKISIAKKSDRGSRKMFEADHENGQLSRYMDRIWNDHLLSSRHRLQRDGRHQTCIDMEDSV
jgi:hypothetical protein